MTEAMLMICRDHIWLNTQNNLSDGDASICHMGPHGKKQQPFIVKQICVILQQIKTLAESESTRKVIYSTFLHLCSNEQPVIQ